MHEQDLRHLRYPRLQPAVGRHDLLATALLPLHVHVEGEVGGGSTDGVLGKDGVQHPE